MRDKHEIHNASTSPPPKRKKRISVEECEDVEDMETEDVEDISLRIEDMEIDNSEEELLKKLRKRKERLKRRK